MRKFNYHYLDFKTDEPAMRFKENLFVFFVIELKVEKLNAEAACTLSHHTTKKMMCNNF